MLEEVRYIARNARAVLRGRQLASKRQLLREAEFILRNAYYVFDRRRRTMDLNKVSLCVITMGDTVFDVGANTGYVGTLWFSRLVGGRGNVFAFEPQPFIFSELERRVKTAAFSNVTTCNKALSDRVGEATLFIDARDSALMGPASTIVPALATADRLGAGYNNLVVETDTLDNFCETQNVRPDFIKIDVEGAENKVIRGGRNVIADALPTIYFECAFGSRGESTTPNHALNNDELLSHVSYLEELGYHLFVVDVFYYRGEWVQDKGLYQSKKLLPVRAKEFPDFSPVLANLIAIHTLKLARSPIRSHVSETGALEFLTRS